MKKLLFIASISSIASTFIVQTKTTDVPFDSTEVEDAPFGTDALLQKIQENPDRAFYIHQVKQSLRTEKTSFNRATTALHMVDRYIVGVFLGEGEKKPKHTEAVMIDIFDGDIKESECMHKRDLPHGSIHFYPKKICPSCKQHAATIKQLVLSHLNQ